MSHRPGYYKDNSAKRRRSPAYREWMKTYHRGWRQRRAAQLNIVKEEHGGKCKLCGYDKNYSALTFHHLDPDAKSFSISDSLRGSKGIKTQSINSIRMETRKCILVCFNCHQDIHHKEWRK